MYLEQYFLQLVLVVAVLFGLRIFLVLRMVLEVPDLQYKMSIKKQWCF